MAHSSCYFKPISETLPHEDRSKPGCSYTVHEVQHREAISGSFLPILVFFIWQMTLRQEIFFKLSVASDQMISFPFVPAIVRRGRQSESKWSHKTLRVPSREATSSHVGRPHLLMSGGHIFSCREADLYINFLHLSFSFSSIIFPLKVFTRYFLGGC